MVHPPRIAESPELGAEPAATPCLSDEDVLAFALGRLQESRLPAAHQHLDQCETCQRLLSEAAHALATAATAPIHGEDELGWNTTFRPGTLVGKRYLIRRFIARGGMGEVYEAFDNELQERVALKTVTSTACDNPNAVRRLKGEVQLARRVSHPNVCRSYDFGTHVIAHTGAQISFLTMEFVDGETLGQRVRLAGALPIDEARKLGRQLLNGLKAAHEAGVLHRDFKSDNVMLRYEAGDETWPLILDFGLARALEADAESGASSSNPNLVGTFGYIAPEQLEGRPHSRASDVYALGIVWFEMLTGELPFGSGSSPAVAALERLQKPAPAPSTKNPEVPADLDQIVLGCLRRSPKDRYRTAAEALTALDLLESRMHSSFQKRKLLPPAIAAALGVIAAYLALSGQPRRPAARSPARTLSAALPASLSVAASSIAGSRVEAASQPSRPRTPPAEPRQTKRSLPALDRNGPTRRMQSASKTSQLAPSAPPVSSAAPEPVPEQKPGWEDPFRQKTAPVEAAGNAQPG